MSHPHRHIQLKKMHGFTLLEMVVVILALSIMAGLTAPLFSQGLTATRTTADNLQTIEKLRFAAERLAREIRQVNHNGTSYDISSMTTTTLSFNSVINTGNTVTISYSGSSVSMSYSTPSLAGALTDEVSGFSFAYYDAAGVTTVSTTDVAFVEFTLTLQNPISGGNFTQRTRVALRDQS